MAPSRETPDLPPPSADRALAQALETERARSIRRRIIWCCIVGIFLMLIGVLGHGMDLIGLPLEADKNAANIPAPSGTVPDPASSIASSPRVRPAALVLFISTSLSTLVLTRGLVGAARTKPQEGQSRDRLVRTLTLLMLSVFGVCVPAEVVAQWADLNFGSRAIVERVYEDPARAGYTATNAFGIFFLLACLAVPMRWRESLRIALPGLALVVVCVATLLLPPWKTTATLAALGLGYSVAGSAWSAWRWADFDARIRALAFGSRYNDLSGEAREISAELREARRLHESFFPALAVLQGETRTPLRIAFRYEPARQIGGDFLDVYREPVSPPGDPGRSCGGVTIAVIDVSGHGVAAALAVGRLHAQLRRFFTLYPVATATQGGPGHLLAELNAFTYQQLAEQGIYATAIIVHIRPDGSSPPLSDAATLRWANAGHPPGYLLHASAAVTDLEPTTIMLGVLSPDEFAAQERSTPIMPGERAIIYTDGAIEARDEHGAEFTSARFRQTAMALSLAPNTASSRPSPILDGLFDAVQTHCAGRIADDTLIVEVTIPPTAAGESPASAQLTPA